MIRSELLLDNIDYWLTSIELIQFLATHIDDLPGSSKREIPLWLAWVLRCTESIDLHESPLADISRGYHWQIGYPAIINADDQPRLIWHSYRILNYLFQTGLAEQSLKPEIFILSDAYATNRTNN